MIKEERRRRQQAEKIRTVIRFALIIVIVVCVAAIGIYLIQEKNAAKVYEAMQAESVTIPAEIQKAEDTETAESKSIWSDIPEVDFDTLWETNIDICAWIYVPGTQVNYPVLRNTQTSDLYDSYYLQHTVDKSEGLPGAVYMEPCNMPDFTDKNSVLYGHHMKNGSMFASLDDYLDEAFMEENPYVYIVTPQKNVVYQVFGAVIYDDTHIMRNYDFTEDESYQTYLDSIVSNGNEKDVLSEGIEVTTQDRIITLSTCVKNQDDKRLLVVAVLVDEYER